MKILHLVQWLSDRQDSGGVIRSANLARLLARFADVDAIGFGSGDHRRLESAPALRHYRKLCAVRLDGPLSRSLWAAANLARGYSLRSSAFRSPAYRRQVDAALRTTSYDAIQAEGLCILQNLDSVPADLPVVYSAHNVESVLSERLLSARTALARPFVALDRRRTEAEERRALQTARLCLAVSAADKHLLQRLGPDRACPIHVIPNCVGDEIVPAADLALHPDRLPEAVSIASFQWYPNSQGALWLLDEVVPRLASNATRCSIRFVGSGIGPRLATRILAAGCAYSPNPAATLPFLHNARAALVPLLIGGGTRLKIVEAWAAGVPVISTSVGAAGLDCTHGVDALLADEPAAFADALRQVLEDDDLHQRLRANGLRRAETLRWSKVAVLVERLYSGLLRTPGRSAV